MSCPLVLACDTAYAMQLATTLRSIVETNRSGWPLEFHVLSDGLLKNTNESHEFPANRFGIDPLGTSGPGALSGCATPPYMSKMTLPGS